MIKFKQLSALCACLLLSLVFVGCNNMKERHVGTAVGAGTGALVGSQIGHGSGRTVATVGGAAVGAVIGHHVGKQME